MKEWEKKRGNVRKEDSTGMETKNSFFLINSGRIKRRENHSLEHEQKRREKWRGQKIANEWILPPFYELVSEAPIDDHSSPVCIEGKDGLLCAWSHQHFLLPPLLNTVQSLLRLLPLSCFSQSISSLFSCLFASETTYFLPSFLRFFLNFSLKLCKNVTNLIQTWNN